MHTSNSEGAGDSSVMLVGDAADSCLALTISHVLDSEHFCYGGRLCHLVCGGVGVTMWHDTVWPCICCVIAWGRLLRTSN